MDAIRDAAQDDLLRQFLEALPVGVFILWADGKPFYANQQARHLLGKGLDARADPDQLAETYAAYQAETDELYPSERMPIVRALRGERHHVDDMVIKRGEQVTPLEVWAAPLFDAHGCIVAAMATFVDISARRRAEHEARRHHAHLTHVCRLTTIGQMAAILAHEINQPLAAIGNFAKGSRKRLACQKLDRPQLEGILDEIIAQAERVSDIIRGIRRLVARQEHEMGRVDLNDVVNRAVQFMGPEMRQSSVRTAVELADGLPAIVGDALQLEQVVVNLLQNGIEAMEDLERTERLLTVRTGAVETDMVELVVADSGDGIDSGDHETVFQPFHTTKSHGVGMGLTISRSIVEAHLGQVQVRSRPGRGAAFHVVLPVSR